MDPVLSLLSGIAPLVYLISAVVAHRAQDTRLAMAAVRPAAAIAVGLSLLAAVGVAVDGPSVSPLLGYAGWGLQLRVDALSTTMFVLIASVGAVVLRFGRNYLAGERNQFAFFRDVSLTLAAVLMLVLAGNLGQLVLAWTATSLSLHRLLQFFRHRPAARKAARKKFFVARASDLFVVAGAVTLYLATSTADIGAVVDVARAAVAAGSVPPLLGVSAVLMVLAAATKSAAFPTHAWLLDVMEAPTPVSALLHAGLINAGGFLLIRLSDVILASPTALALLCGVGLVTALFGTLVSATQARVKRALAFSTVGQMGFMLLQCGLGSFTSAAVHLVVHSVYKAHALPRGRKQRRSTARAGERFASARPPLGRLCLRRDAARLGGWRSVGLLARSRAGRIRSRSSDRLQPGAPAPRRERRA